MRRPPLSAIAPVRSAALAFAFLIAASACSPREPGFAPNEWLSWRIIEADVEFSRCSDAPVWRDQFSAPDVSSGNQSVTVAIDPSGKEALLMSCMGGSACAVAQPEVRFTVAGTELLHGSNSRLEVSQSTCQVAVAEVIVIVDEGQTMSLQNALTFTLVEDDAACASFDANLRGQSANGAGIDGCVVTFNMKGQL